MTEKQREFLTDTRDMLIDYDGFNSVESLKGLIDEARARLSAALSGDAAIDAFEKSMGE